MAIAHVMLSVSLPKDLDERLSSASASLEVRKSDLVTQALQEFFAKLESAEERPIASTAEDR